MRSKILLLCLSALVAPAALTAQDAATATAPEAATGAAPETSLLPIVRPPEPEAVIATLSPDVGRTLEGLELAEALTEMRRGRWAEARALARSEGPVAEDVILWHELRARRGSWAEAQDFIARNGDWPGMTLLRARAERLMPDDAAPQVVMDYFLGAAPRTGTGARHLARALRGFAEPQAAAEVLAAAWTDLTMTAAEEDAILRDVRAHHPGLLDDLHEARLDMLLWEDAPAGARRAMDRVDGDWRALAAARLALRAEANGVDGLVAAVPDRLKADPGLAYERFRWRLEKGLDDSAYELMLQQSTSAEALGRPDLWAEERRVQARRLMRAGQAQAAYDMASTGFTSDGVRHRDLLWLSGFLALTDLGRPEDALAHFETGEVGSTSPISLSRMQYWQGRAHEELGDLDAAAEDYVRAAEHQTAFYGQLAAERVEAPVDPLLAADLDAEMPEALAQSSVLEASRLLLKAGERRLSARFIAHLGESQDREGLIALGEWAQDQGSEYLQVTLGKRAASMGIVLPEYYFPLHPVKDANLPVPPELTLAIARRESEFHPGVASGVGAQGLMQLMPATAAEVATELGLRHTRARLIDDPDYNAVLGSRYLANLEDRFGYNIPMMAAGYNAGPSRPARWIGEFGDIRRMDIDAAVDWIEHIQFRETRNYVQRVAESIPLYRMQLSGEVEPLGMEAILTGTRR